MFCEKPIYNPLGHSCAILARIFGVLAWDRKISRYLGIVLRLSLNFIILGIGIEIEIEFWILQYWYWYWYLVLMFLILRLRLILKFLALVSIIGIVSFHKLIGLCNQGVNSLKVRENTRLFCWKTLSQLLFCPDSAIFSKTQEILPICLLWCKYFFHKLTLYYLFGQIVNPNL